MITNEKNRLLVVILGPTASGKSGLSVDLAGHYDSPIISADSRQFYREMKIGTCRMTPQETRGVPLYFSGNIGINEYYSAGRFENEVIDFLESYYLSNHLAFLTGGTGFYINAVCEGVGDTPPIEMEIRDRVEQWHKEMGEEGLIEKLRVLDPEYYNQVDRNNTKRILRALEVIEQTGLPYSVVRKGEKKTRNFRVLKIGLELPREELYERIERRVDAMILEGLEEEARELYPDRDKVALNTVGYKEIFEYIDGKYDLKEAIRRIKRNTRHYAKRQLTWFKKDSSIIWVHPLEINKIKNIIDQGLSGTL